LIEDAKIVFAGGMPRNAMRVLEETQAAELGSMVPADLYNQIHGLLGKYSLVDKMAAKGLLTIYQTDKLTFTVPAETTAMVALADIAEEGAYTANEMAFLAKTATMQKVGNYLSVSEEALEDQDLFQQYLVKACAKAIALSKNVDLHVLCDAVAGVAIGTTDVIIDDEITANYYGLAQEYRDGACYIMNDLTLAYIRAMLIATPRAYGEFGFMPMSMGELGETFLNHFVFTNANWVALVGGATNDIGVTFANFDEGIYWVERRGLSIFVDPYSTKLSAGTVNFLPSARYGGVTVNAAAFSGIELLT
jgi:HK97 family phage major capsid protein